MHRIRTSGAVVDVDVVGTTRYSSIVARCKGSPIVVVLEMCPSESDGRRQCKKSIGAVTESTPARRGGGLCLGDAWGIPTRDVGNAKVTRTRGVGLDSSRSGGRLGTGNSGDVGVRGGQRERRFDVSISVRCAGRNDNDRYVLRRVVGLDGSCSPCGRRDTRLRCEGSTRCAVTGQLIVFAVAHLESFWSTNDAVLMVVLRAGGSVMLRCLVVHRSGGILLLSAVRSSATRLGIITIGGAFRRIGLYRRMSDVSSSRVCSPSLELLDNGENVLSVAATARKAYTRRLARWLRSVRRGRCGNDGLRSGRIASKERKSTLER